MAKIPRRMAQVFHEAAAQPITDSGASTNLYGYSADYKQVREIPIDYITPNPNQPRRHFDDDELSRLASSILRHGLIHPILVRETGPAQYELIAGERRWRACQRIDRTSIFAFVVEGDPDELALVENLQRADLDPFEVARALSRLVERHHYTHQMLGDVVGRSQPDVTRSLQLLALPPTIQGEYGQFRHVSRSVLSELAAVDDVERQLVLWDRAKEGATVKEIRAAKGIAPAKSVPDTPKETAATGTSLVRVVRGTMRRLSAARDSRQVLTDKQRRELADLRKLIDQLLESASCDVA